MSEPIPYVRDLDFTYGKVAQVSPSIRRVIAHNPSVFTFHGTGTYIVGRGNVAIIDAGPDLADHVDAVLAAVRGETVTHLVVTHTHIDHSPATRHIKAATGAPSYGFGPHGGGRGAGGRGGRGPRLRARSSGGGRSGDRRQRVDAGGRAHAGAHLEPSLLHAGGRACALLGRSRHGVVDHGGLAAGWRHGRLYGLARKAQGARRGDLLADARAADSEAAAFSSASCSPTGASERRRSIPPSRKARRPFQRSSPCATGGSTRVSAPLPPGRCSPT